LLVKFNNKNEVIMEHWWISWQMSKFKQKELLQEAISCRQLKNDGGRLGRSEKTARQPRVCRQPMRLQLVVLALRNSLGQRLIDWGTILRQQQSPTPAQGAQTKHC
jgi:hypothetical protein